MITERVLGQWCLVVIALLMATSWAGGGVFPDPSIPHSNSTGNNRSQGLKNALYFYVRDAQSAPLSPASLQSIADRESEMRQFFASSSGGTFDIYFDHVIDVPLALDGDKRRPDNWRSLVDNYAADALGINVDHYYAHIYDVSATTPDVDQGWAGVYYGGTDLALQNPSPQVLVHELGHRASADHASAWRGHNGGDLYAWNPRLQDYEPYIPGVSSHNPMPLGVQRDEYGNPFDVMGNITAGDFRIGEKLRDLRWLDSPQVGDLNSLGEGTYRIYAHDELQPMIDGWGNYGVGEGYAEGVHYGLTFTRAGERLDTTGLDAGTWDRVTQVIDLEYRALSDQVLFYLDFHSGLAGEQSNNSVLLDLDPAGGTSRGDTARGLRVGQSIEDISFGLSTYHVNDPSDPDFLSLAPLPPTDPQLLRPEWFYFHVLDTGADGIGSYIDLWVETVTPLNGLAGDLNQDFVVDHHDLQLFIAGWRSDTSQMHTRMKYSHGDIDLNGITDLRDAGLMRHALLTHGLDPHAMAGLLAVPEPGTLPTGLLIAIGLWLARRRRSAGRFGHHTSGSASATQC